MLRNLFGNKKRGQDKMMTVGMRPSAPAPIPHLARTGTNTPYQRNAVRPAVVAKSSPLRGDSPTSVFFDEVTPTHTSCNDNYGGYESNSCGHSDSTPSSCD